MSKLTPRNGFTFSLFCALVVASQGFDFSFKKKGDLIDVNFQKKDIPLPLLTLCLPLIGLGLGVEISHDFPIRISRTEEENELP